MDDLSRHVNISKFYLIRIFKQYTGSTPYEYIKFAKINYCKELLLTTNDSLEQISDSIGYGNASSFIRAFKDITKLTPLEYKHLNNK